MIINKIKIIIDDYSILPKHIGNLALANAALGHSARDGYYSCNGIICVEIVC